MVFFRNKKVIALVAIAITSLVIVVILSVILLLNPKNLDYNFAQSIKEESLLLKQYIHPETIDKELKILRDKKSSKKSKYEALQRIYNIFDYTYSDTSLPRIRDFSFKLNEFAEKNYKEFHKKGSFLIACADSVCGEETPSEILNLIEKINTIPTNEAYKNAVINNLKGASHIPYTTNSQKFDKMLGYYSAYSILMGLNIKQASESGIILKKFVKEKYNQDL